nr:mucin-2-like [Procambarus clarkii]
MMETSLPSTNSDSETIIMDLHILNSLEDVDLDNIFRRPDVTQTKTNSFKFNPPQSGCQTTPLNQASQPSSLTPPPASRRHSRHHQPAVATHAATSQPSSLTPPPASRRHSRHHQPAVVTHAATSQPSSLTPPPASRRHSRRHQPAVATHAATSQPSSLTPPPATLDSTVAALIHFATELSEEDLKRRYRILNDLYKVNKLPTFVIPEAMFTDRSTQPEADPAAPVNPDPASTSTSAASPPIITPVTEPASQPPPPVTQMTDPVLTTAKEPEEIDRPATPKFLNPYVTKGKLFNPYVSLKMAT